MRPRSIFEKKSEHTNDNYVEKESNDPWTHFVVISRTPVIRATARVRSIFLSLSSFICRSSGTRGIHVEKLHVTNRGACMIAFPITFPRYWIIQLVSSREREIHGWHQMVPTWERDCQYVFDDGNFHACTEKCVWKNQRQISFCLNSIFLIRSAFLFRCTSDR